MNRFLILISAAAIVSTSLVAQQASRPLQSAEVECNRVFEEARRLPSPSVRSIANYNNRVIDQGGRCLDAGLQGPTRVHG